MKRIVQDLVSRGLGYPLALPLRDGEVRRARRLVAAKRAAAFDSPEAMRAAQEERLRALLAHCAKTVPYYRQLFAAAGYDPAAPDARREFHRLPVLTKDLISERGEDLLSEAARSSRLYPNSSGGSTGRMVSFYQDQRYRDHFLASLWASNQMQGWRYGSRVAVLWGAPRDVTELQRPRARLRLYVENTRFFDAFDMTPARMEDCHRSLAEFAPDLIVAYASSIHLFARYLEQRRTECRYPRVSIISSAEMLTPEMRDQIGRVFHVPVFDRYGSREVGVIASECGAHEGLHVNVSDLYLECVDDAGRPVPEGTPGELAVTVLNNYAMPFLRYRIEDVGIFSSAPCACGRRSPRIRKLLGRSSDVIVGAGGRLIHGEYFTHLFYGLPQIRQFQFVQESRDRFRLLVVPGEGFTMDMTRPLESEMKDVLGESARVTWDLVSRIPPLPSGKHRFTVSHVVAEPAGNRQEAW